MPDIAHTTDGSGAEEALAMLDRAPADLHALRRLVAAARRAPDKRLVDELFRRVQASVLAAASPDERRDAWWRQLALACFFDRYDLVTWLISSTETLAGQDPQRRAQLGALHLDLAHEQLAESILRGVVGTPLGAYHLARLHLRRKRWEKARRALAVVDGKSPFAPAARAQRALVRGDATALDRARDLGARALGGPPVAPSLPEAELLVVALRAAVLADDPDGARALGHRLVVDPLAGDPSVLSRATVCLGALAWL